MTAATTVSETLVDQLSRDLSRGTGDLPVLPKAAEEALNLAQSPHLQYEDVVRAAEVDPPLAARFLSVANSALYSRGTPITTIKAALVRLGIQTTRDLLYQRVYGATLFKVPEYQTFVNITFRHSIIVARQARKIAGFVGQDQDLMFLAGLLHDVGRARCLQLVAKRAKNTLPLEMVLSAVDTLHARAGADLAIAWKLPTEVVEACEWHHNPEGKPYAMTVMVGDVIARSVETKPRATPEEVVEALAMLCIEPKKTELIELATQDQQNYI